MKNFSSRFFATILLAMSLLISCHLFAATQYCGETSANANFTFSLMNVSGNTYRVQLDAVGTDKFASTYNINCGVNQSAGAGIFFGGDNAANWVISDDRAYIDFTTASVGSVPTGFYGNYFCFNKKGGGLIEISGFNPSDVDWTATCSGGCSDNTAPTITTVSVGTVTYNSVVLTITAADNDGGSGISRYIVKNGETQIASVSSSPLTVSGLTAATTYSNIKVYAKDACDNISEAFDVEEFTTGTRDSECEGDLGHFATWETKRIHYTIQYLPTINKIRYEVHGYGTQVLDYLEINTTSGNSGTVSIVNGVAVWKQDAPAAGTEIGIQFVYSTDAIPVNEINAENTSSFVGNNAHLVYYKSRDCEADIEPAYAPTTAPDESTIFNDCQIYSVLGTQYYLAAGFNNETNAWGDGTATTATIDGRQVLHIAGSRYLERGFNPHDVSGFTHIHFDVWTQEAMALGIKLMAYQDGWKEGDRQNFTTNAGSWKSVDLPLSGFNHGFLTQIQGIYPLDMRAQDVYFTNIYFYKTTDDVACYETLNLAEGKPCEGGFVPGNAGEVPAKANDGKADTKWVTYANRPTDEEWWYVDLMNNYAIDSIAVVWGADYSTNYILQTRTDAPSSSDKADDAAWVTIATVTDAAANSTQENSFTTATGRYVRLHSLSRSSNCIRLAEVKVFASGYAVADTNNPVITKAEVANDSENITSVKLHLVATDEEDGVVTSFLLDKGDGSWLPIVTDASNTYTVPDLTRGHYSYKVKARDHAGNISAISTINFDILNPADNLVLNRSVVAGYTPSNPGEVPAKANDGNLGTPWTTYNDQPMDVQWWSVDLGDVYQLSDIELFWDVRSDHYLIQVAHSEPDDRSDDTQWYTVLEVNETQTTGATEADKNHYSLNASARYLRFKALTKSGTFLKLWELRTFASAFADLDSNAPVLNTASVSYDDGKAYLTLTAADTEDVTVKTFRVVNTTTGYAFVGTTDAGNKIELEEDLSVGTAYSFEVQAMDKAANLSAVRQLIVNLPLSFDNIAVNKPVVAGYAPENLAEAPAKANDGNTDTKWVTWASRPASEEWWYVDLEDVYYLEKIVVKWGADYSTDYILQIRTDAPSLADAADDASWTTMAEVTDAAANSAKVTNVSGRGRYVRFRSKTRNSNCIRMAEFEVYAGAKLVSLDETTDNSSVLSANNGATANVELSRSFTAGTLYTLCLPFSMPAAQLAEVFGAGYELHKLMSSERKANDDILLNFVKVADMTAGTPYLFRPAQSVSSPLLESVVIDAGASTTVTTDLFEMIGYYDRYQATEDDLFLGSDTYLHKSSAKSYGFRARFRFVVPNMQGVRARAVLQSANATDVATEIDLLEEVDAVITQKIIRDGQLYIIRDGVIYNAQGQRVE